MARILLLGGTGAMGVYLRDVLAQRGDMVFVTSRRERKDEERIRYIRGDAHDDGFFRSAVETACPDAIVDFMIYPTDEFRARRDMLVSASGQYVFLSSYRVFAEQVPLTERSPRLLDVCHDPEYLATDEYALRKAREEDILRNGAEGNWTIVRPAITYSRDRFQFGVLEAGMVCWRAFHNLPVTMPAEMLDKETTMTWGGDVARMIAGLVGNANAMGEDFNCATQEHRKWREIAEIYRKAIGLEVVPCSTEDYIWGSNRYQVMVDRMFNRVVDNAKVLSVTGISPTSFTPPEKGLPMELAEFRKQGGRIWTSAERNACMDKVTGTRIPLSALREFSSADRKLYLKTRYSEFLKGSMGRSALCIASCALATRRRILRILNRYARNGGQ